MSKALGIAAVLFYWSSNLPDIESSGSPVTMYQSQGSMPNVKYLANPPTPPA